MKPRHRLVSATRRFSYADGADCACTPFSTTSKLSPTRPHSEVNGNNAERGDLVFIAVRIVPNVNAKKVGWNGLLVGDMSQPSGGPMLSDRISHQVGLDVDIWFTPMPDHVQSR